MDHHFYPTKETAFCRAPTAILDSARVGNRLLDRYKYKTPKGILDVLYNH